MSELSGGTPTCYKPFLAPIEGINILTSTNVIYHGAAEIH